MKLSVIIPVFNGADTIAEQLNALAEQTAPEPFEVIISDNGSTDASLTIANRFMGRVPNLRIIDSSHRRGRSYARNSGAESAANEALAFCDQDDIVGDGWVRAMAKALDSYDFVAGSIETRKLNKPWRIKHFSFPEHELYVHKSPPYLAHAPGCNLGVKRAVHKAVGGFDESLMLAWEDTDYAFRIQLGGTRLQFVEEAVCHYRLRHDLVGIYRQARNYGKGYVSLYKKYAPLTPTREPWKVKFSFWRHLLGPRTILGLRKKPELVHWLWQVGWSVGQVRGCLESGVRAPLWW